MLLIVRAPVCAARCFVLRLIGCLAPKVHLHSFLREPQFACQLLQGESQSALLRCLPQLDVDAWAHALLPLLQEQHSAAAVALTCRTLRDRCHSNVQNLDLSSLQDSGDTDELQDALRSLPGQFSSCKNVQLVLEAETSYHNIAYLLPSIARWDSLPMAMQRGEGEPAGSEGEAAVWTS